MERDNRKINKKNVTNVSQYSTCDKILITGFYIEISQKPEGVNKSSSRERLCV